MILLTDNTNHVFYLAGDLRDVMYAITFVVAYQIYHLAGHK